MTRKDVINSTDTVVNSMVRIAGTNFDRRRKVTNDIKHRMQQMVDAGKSYFTIANHFNVTPYTVRLNTDAAFRASEYNRRSNYPQYSETGSSAERAEYKRNLLRAGKKLAINY